MGGLKLECEIVDRGYGPELENGELGEEAGWFYRHTENLQAACAYPFHA